MGAISNAFPTPHDRIDFAAVKAAAITSIEMLVPRWLPNGKRVGSEWVALNPTRNDGKPGSFSINMNTGIYSDFATGDKGGDPIDLYVYLFGGTLLEAATEIGDILGVRRISNVSQLRPASRDAATPTVSSRRVRELMTPDLSQRDPDSFPPRTPPDKDGKPRFVVAADEGPRAYSDEKRRHYYKAGVVPIKIKVMRNSGDALIWYRVSDNGMDGWQFRKPAGFRDVAFIGHLDPFDPERLDEPVYWPEGEKDTDSVTNKGALAATFGGVGDGLPADCETYFAGRDVIVLADNDGPGRKHADEKAALVYPVAASVKVIHFPHLPPKGDVTDYFQTGHSLEDLRQIISQTSPYKFNPATIATTAADHSQPRPAIKATASAGETEVTVESSRGGKALTDGCRSVRVLNRMSKEEGETAGVENPRVHFRTYIDKANLAPPAEASTWFKLASVDLGNGSNGGYGDNIGVVVPWHPMADVSVSDLRAVQAIVSGGRYRASPHAEVCVGKAVAEALRLDLSKPNDKRKAINLLKVWVGSGALKKVDEKDDKGMPRAWIVVGEWTND
jgi:hypothetical protein